ncbi:MAG TPA: DegT/DnrJ/EryC1/StrS family aminotransferase [Candidatus Hydrogenedentes bacterium]|nr:DegT/DnrJ/EryC1/StrS family aminotransferase [Candidatus Hydrogenedentota bacterium]HOL75579.1 DegT/DnrJ/EryC1/StrS family aminotransferase [Candidatus Hydrogenedentota bacterium]HPO86997.1 DegT/DnrJ/EryC1/StrS family aminotransferase [Candidatus Hydrogenedentota bacterium]
MEIISKEKLALFGGEPVRSREKKWMTWPIYGEEERRALNEVLESGKWWYGDRVKTFEQEYAAFQDARHCITASSGTTALEVCLQSLGLEPGDEVIVPAYTFIATASAVVRSGGIPVFVDVDETWNIDLKAVEKAMTAKTRAIIPVHFGGRICDMDALRQLASEKGISIIEDACHSWGGKWKGKGTGALGLGGVFSFQMSKNITSGEGGAITTDDDAFAETVRSITNCGRGGDGVWYGHVRVGTNVRMTEFQAAILSAQLTRLEAQTLLRERNGKILDENLSKIEGLTVQPGDPRITRRAYHLYCLRVDADRFGCSRKRLVEAAQAEGLPLSVGYGMPLYKQPAFSQSKNAERYAHCSCPVAEDLCYKSGMWLFHTILLGTEQDMQDIVNVFAKIKENVRELAE